ncbi:twin-arginine translocation pathway signal [Sulfitobacter alexandrii]|uniref:Twin-arginine translocation pathway signal n=1 Tax=Sulfitobacter alexandrii TaxID=1917485 RepID=A0A1J0WEJ8_9RHOB|nr:DUF1513 domain-containing protein [Sulfitobacter alexandrii]APE42731.1 twin-arginine translocation pathway signal [Sulfitobacter alexandrii]
MTRRTDTGRRRFLGGLIAAGVIPRPTWADAGSPAYLAAGGRPDGSYLLCGIGADLSVRFELPLPARGHAAAAHPSRPQAVAFARRPGTFALVIDCASGRILSTLASPEGRHFYGHGAYSQAGDLLYTTENDFTTGTGRIGVWDVTAGYVRVGEIASGGIGPHDIRRLPGSDTLVVANGGIDTHPDSGRAKLNIPTMAPNLTYIEAERIVEQAALPKALHKNSIRHLAVGPQGEVALGMQWQGEEPVDALVGLHRRGSEITLFDAPAEAVDRMQGYIGSVACSADGATIAVTSPRGGMVQFYDTATMALTRSEALEDVCGIAPAAQGFTVTTGTGTLRCLRDTAGARASAALMWDNHLVAL